MKDLRRLQRELDSPYIAKRTILMKPDSQYKEKILLHPVPLAEQVRKELFQVSYILVNFPSENTDWSRLRRQKDISSLHLPLR